MHICTVKSSAIATALQKTIRVRQSNALLPVLESIHCKTIKGGLVLTGTNLENTIITGIKADVKEVGKEFLIPLKVQTILLQLKGVDIEIENGEALSFKYNDNVIKVPAEKAADFPTTPKPETLVKFKIDDAEAFRKLMEMHKKFTSNDELRPAMTAVRFTNKLMTATNAHRLSLTKYKTDGEFDVLLSKTFISSFASIESAVTIQVCKDYIVANDKDCKVIARIIDARFPDVQSVIPEESPVHIEVERAEMISNIKIAMNMSDKTTKMLQFDFVGDGYELKAFDNDLTEEVKMKGGCMFKVNKSKLTEFSIALNGVFLLQQLELLTEEIVTFEVEKANRCILFHEGDNTFLLMPLMNNK